MRKPTVCATLLVFWAPLALSAHEATDMEHAIDNMLAIDGIAQIVEAQERCGFHVNSDALNRYLDERQLLSPDALSMIGMKVRLIRERDGMSADTECEMQRATATKMGVLD